MTWVVSGGLEFNKRLRLSGRVTYGGEAKGKRASTLYYINRKVKACMKKMKYKKTLRKSGVDSSGGVVGSIFRTFFSVPLKEGGVQGW